jgi:predicted glycosyltransferase
VISDNRYGLHHDEIPCIFITHQLHIKSSAGKWTEKLLQKRNYKFINKFKACWVPDAPGETNLAGELSHPHHLPEVPVHYIGMLSRFENKASKHKKNYLLILLSGPEPQRTILEEKIINGISHYPGAATIVRGLPGETTLIPSTGMIHFYNHLPSHVLNNEMLESDFVISRSGYSTVMDIALLNKKSILVPTPGQTEQEYLGKMLSAKKIAACISQEEFSIQKAMEIAASFEYALPEFAEASNLQSTIKAFYASLLNPL